MKLNFGASQNEQYFNIKNFNPTSLQRKDFKEFNIDELDELRVFKKKFLMPPEEQKVTHPHWLYIYETIHWYLEGGMTALFEMTSVLLWAGTNYFKRTKETTVWFYCIEKALWQELPLETVRNHYLLYVYESILQRLEEYLLTSDENVMRYHTYFTNVRKAGLRMNVRDQFLLAIYEKNFDRLLNSSKFEIPTAGGYVLDLKTLNLRKRTIKDYWSKEIPISFNKNTDISFIKEWINSLFLQDRESEVKELYSELPDFLQIILGYLLTGSIEEQKMFLLLGYGSNCKSTLVNFISDILGDFYYSIPPSMIIEAKNAKNHNAGPGPDPFYGNLLYKRVAVSSENDDNSKMKMMKVKSLAGSDKISFRLLRENEIQDINQYFKILHLCNEIPHIPCKNYSDIRKFSLLFFPAVFKPNNLVNIFDPREREMKTDLSKILDNNKEAMLLWMVLGAQKYITLKENKSDIEKITPKIMTEMLENEVRKMNQGMLKPETNDIQIFFDNFLLSCN